MPTLVADAHRPTLPELAPKWVVRLLAALLVLVVVGAVLLAQLSGEDEEPLVVSGAGLTFNVLLPAELERVSPEGDELVRLRNRDPEQALEQLAISPLVLPAHRGDVGGVLAVVADRERRRLERTVPGFELALEAKSRVVRLPAYQLAYKGLRGGRRVYGRVVLFPEPEPRSTRALRMQVEIPFSAGARKAEDAGALGPTKRPYRSLRWGAERP